VPKRISSDLSREHWDEGLDPGPRKAVVSGHDLLAYAFAAQPFPELVRQVQDDGIELLSDLWLRDDHPNVLPGVVARREARTPSEKVALSRARWLSVTYARRDPQPCPTFGGHGSPQAKRRVSSAEGDSRAQTRLRVSLMSAHILSRPIWVVKPQKPSNLKVPSWLCRAITA